MPRRPVRRMNADSDWADEKTFDVQKSVNPSRLIMINVDWLIHTSEKPQSNYGRARASGSHWQPCRVIAATQTLPIQKVLLKQSN